CGCSRSLTGGELCSDGQLSAGESDVDCGGPCKPCSTGQGCVLPGDCTSAICADGICASAPGDGPGGQPVDFGPPDLLQVPCPFPPMGEWHVSPSGSDTATVYAGNGSAACPLQTLIRAVQLAQLDGFSATIYPHKGSAPPATYNGVAIS